MGEEERNPVSYEGVDVEAGGVRLAAQLRRVLHELPQLGGGVCASW